MTEENIDVVCSELARPVEQLLVGIVYTAGMSLVYDTVRRCVLAEIRIGNVGSTLFEHIYGVVACKLEVAQETDFRETGCCHRITLCFVYIKNIGGDWIRVTEFRTKNGDFITVTVVI